jgi:hypothetical protein
MYFEKAGLDSDIWTPIEPELLRKELGSCYSNPDAIIDLVLQGGLAKTCRCQYRKRIPTEVIDWAKILPR